MWIDIFPNRKKESTKIQKMLYIYIQIYIYRERESERLDVVCMFTSELMDHSGGIYLFAGDSWTEEVIYISDRRRQDPEAVKVTSTNSTSTELDSSSAIKNYNLDAAAVVFFMSFTFVGRSDF